MTFTKKKLQKIADKSMESANNIEFKQKIENMLEEKKEGKAHINKKLIWAISSVATVIVVVCISVFLGFYFQKENESDIGYCEEFEKNMQSSVSELNSYLQEFSFNDLGLDINITRQYDEISKDTLMFLYSYDNYDYIDVMNYYSVDMHIITNQKYIDRYYEDKIFGKRIDYHGYQIEYKETVEEIDGIFEYNIEGKLVINQTIMYFKYQNFAFEENSGMIEMLDTIIEFN